MVERSKCMNVPELRFKGFKQEWDFCSVGDFYYFKNGLNKGKEFFGYGTPIVNFTDVFNNRGLTSDILKGRVSLSKKEISSFEVKKGDIFFTRTSETLEEIGYASVMLDESNDTVFSGFVLRGRAINEDPLSDLFKKYVFFTNDFRKEMIRKSSMTTRALTSGTSIKKMEFYFPENKMEQEKIGIFHSIIDKEIIFITTRIKLLKQVKAASLQSMFPQEGETVPKVRFKGFEGEWEEKSFSALYKKSIIKNDLTFGTDKIISVANMYYLTNVNVSDLEYLKTYNIMKLGDIAFEGNKSKRFLHGRFVENTIGDGIVSHVFVVFHPISAEHDINYWKYAINNENIMRNVLIRCTKSSTMMTDLVVDDFLKETILVPTYAEQQKIGAYFRNLDRQISLQTQRLEKLKQIKAACLDKMFV